MTDQQIISKSPLFAGIAPEHIDDALTLLHARKMSYGPGELLLRIGEPLRYARLILAGSVEASFFTESIDQVGMVRFYRGDLFGEALSSLHEESPMEVVAIKPCTVLLIDLEPIFAKPSTELAARLLVNLARSLARKNAMLNAKVRILGQHSVRDRVSMYFHQLKPGADNARIIPYNRTELARNLSVNRSALSRELSRMQDEDIIVLEGNRVWFVEDL